MNVLVTDGNQRSTLAVVRALGEAGLSVSVGDCEPTSLAGTSRHCAARISYPSPLTEGKGFLAFLSEEIRRHQYQVLIPMNDISMQLISLVRDSWASRVRVPFPAAPIVNRVQDKGYVLSLAQKMDIPCPKTFLFEGPEQLDASSSEIPLPAVIKPRFSRFQRDGKWISGPVNYVQDYKTLAAEYSRAHKLIPDPLVQERIEGEGKGVFLLLWNGELKAAFCHRRLREKPPWGGVSVFCESLPLDKDLVDQSYALLKALGWQGAAMVEYKQDRRDGKAKLMEVNGRFWGSLQLSIDAGLNFPLLLCRLAAGEDVKSQFDYKVGAKSRWFFGDLDHLLIRLRHSRGPNGTPPLSGSRLGACLSFMKLYEPGLRYDVWRSNDLGPGWHELKDYCRNLFWRREARKGADRAH